MCLYTKQTKPKIAEEDIICYKFYIRYIGGLTVSPYIGIIAPKIGAITNTELGKPYRPDNNHTYYGFKRVYEGFHSFKILEDVKSVVNKWKSKFNLVIFKCIIPKGSLYYLGKFNKYESYCSDKINLIEVCT